MVKPTERWQSGRMQHTANVLSLKRVPRVRIPPSPQTTFDNICQMRLFLSPNYLVFCTAVSRDISFCCAAIHWLPTGCPKSVFKPCFWFSMSIAVRSVEGATCAYLIVVAIVECPRRACTACRGAPLIASCEAKVCRNGLRECRKFREKDSLRCCVRWYR